MRRLAADALAGLRATIRREPLLVAVGLLGVGLAAALAIVIGVRGPVVPPEGILEKPLTFDLAVGIYVLTLAVLAPLARFSRGGRNAWRAGLAATSLYGFTVETVQPLRGLDPRFSEAAGPADQFFNFTFGIDAIFIILVFAVFATKLFLRPDPARPLFVLGARYGALAVFLGFAGGVWMGVIGGRTWGEDASILPYHALGFHGLQAVPLVAWLLARSSVDRDTAPRWIHAAGLSWLGATAAVGYQTWLGRPVAEAAPASLAAGGLLVVWATVAAAALLLVLRCPAPELERS